MLAMAHQIGTAKLAKEELVEGGEAKLPLLLAGHSHFFLVNWTLWPSSIFLLLLPMPICLLHLKADGQWGVWHPLHIPRLSLESYS